MPFCIVCHLKIEKNDNSHFECENGHPIHSYCLADWLMQSRTCPLCSEPYSQIVLDNFKDFIKEKEKEKQSDLENEQRKESMKKVESVAIKIVFLKFIEDIEHLIEDKNYDVALDLLMDSYDESRFDDKDLKILFLLGKVNYLKGRYDLAINFLFKLVKLKFDYPDAFYFLGSAYEALGMKDKAEWAYERIRH
ncbi:MAG: RING finger domain-containing protein [Candidatus Thorarchaeota archaeon]